MSVAFFTDRNLGKQFPGILEEAGCSVERHDERFAPAACDEEWLQYVGRERMVAITHDSRIRYKPNELQAVVSHRVALLVVVGKAPFCELARNFVHTMPRILRFLSEQDPPFIAKVYRPAAAESLRDPEAAGSISRWYP